MFHFLLLSALALAGPSSASCQVSDTSVVSRSPSGMAQVSNLGLIQIRCDVPARPPMKPGEGRYGLNAAATVYQIASDGAEKPIPSEVNVSGGGSAGKSDWVWFYINIPLPEAEHKAEIRKYIALLETATTDRELRKQLRRSSRNPIWAPIVTQYRVGRFDVDCRVLDGDHLIGEGRLGLEVLFKGRFSDLLLGKK
jgi:hypothetical protein